MIKVLEHKGIKEIATKAKEQLEEEYLKTINILLNKVNNLIDEPELLKKNIDLLFPIIQEYCELFKNEPVVREKIKLDIDEIKKESSATVRYKLALRLLKDIEYMLEISSKQKEREIEHKEDIIKMKDKESKKGFDLLKFIHLRKIPDPRVSSKLTIYRILQNLATPFTISGFIWGVIYVVLDKIQYPYAIGASLIITGFSFLIICIMLFTKKA